MISIKIILISLMIVEITTLIMRFGFHRQSRDYYSNSLNKKWGRYKFHWHHLFLGLLIVPVSLAFSGMFERFLFNLGLGIVLSDLVHHFIVLNILVGESEFHLIYKNKDFCPEDGILTRRSKILNKFTKEV
ncbi:MAG: hypothetical protein KKB21_04900 [Nanoarchaeota archaeon]|nr:hypothetical protein [Nanoarchaeota archaeon]MBU4086885.1 hypothetical protein [Nanoarchaeota archaeon]